MEYNDIPRTLKRYSFVEKMNILQTWSRKTMNLNGVIDRNERGKTPFPWELETLLLFSVTSQEWRQGRFDRNDRNFVAMINCIRNHPHPIVDKLKGTNDLVNELFVALGSVQFEAQEYPYYKLYRYYWYFSFVNSKVNMPEIFREKLGSDYKRYAVLAMSLWMILWGNEYKVSPEVYTFILSQFPMELSHLTITRKEYKIQLKNITASIDDYMYCLRPSYTYPFVEEQGVVYLPLPHLLMRSVTSSMLYRITQDDNHLAQLIGKEVLEPYLYQIVLRSGLFDEVYPEQEYVFHRNKKRTLDVLTRKEGHYVFFDSKMYTPRRDLRIFDQDAYQWDIDRLATNCQQIYEHIRNRFPSQYNLFTRKRLSIQIVYMALQSFERTQEFKLIIFIRGQLIYWQYPGNPLNTSGFASMWESFLFLMLRNTVLHIRIYLAIYMEVILGNILRIFGSLVK